MAARYQEDEILTTLEWTGTSPYGERTDEPDYAASFLFDIGECLEECTNRRILMESSADYGAYYPASIVEDYYRECEAECLAAQGTPY